MNSREDTDAESFDVHTKTKTDPSDEEPFVKVAFLGREASWKSRRRRRLGKDTPPVLLRGASSS